VSEEEELQGILPYAFKKWHRSIQKRILSTFKKRLKSQFKEIKTERVIIVHNVC
jgi:hypothetical protein